MLENQVQPVRAPHTGTRLLFAFAVAITVAILALLGWTLQQKSAPPLAGGGAPDWELQTFSGETVRLANLRGKAIVVNFWASWCIPCRDEAPILEEAWERYRDQGLVIVGIDYVDTDSEAKKFIQKFGITYPNGPDLGTKISQSYRITGVPETYFITREGRLLDGIDANGHVYGNWIGPLTQAALQERIARLMAP